MRRWGSSVEFCPISLSYSVTSIHLLSPACHDTTNSPAFTVSFIGTVVIMPIDLRGKNVLITAGSRGLGAIVAEKFAAEGVHGIAINYASNKDAAEQLKGRLENIATIKDIKVVCLQGDAGVIKDCERLVKEATEQLGGLDVLVSNAVSIIYLV